MFCQLVSADLVQMDLSLILPEKPVYVKILSSTGVPVNLFAKPVQTILHPTPISLIVYVYVVIPNKETTVSPTVQKELPLITPVNVLVVGGKYYKEMYVHNLHLAQQDHLGIKLNLSVSVLTVDKILSMASVKHVRIIVSILHLRKSANAVQDSIESAMLV